MTDRQKLRINPNRIDEINQFLLNEENPLITGLIDVIEKHGGIDEINEKAENARRLDSLLEKLEKKKSPYVSDLQWLQKQRDNDAFISVPNYRRKILGDKVDSMTWDESFAVTLEISACQYFPWVIEEAKHSIENQDLMPGRFIRVRNMAEQSGDNDVIAFAAAADSPVARSV